MVLCKQCIYDFEIVIVIKNVEVCEHILERNGFSCRVRYHQIENGKCIAQRAICLL